MKALFYPEYDRLTISYVPLPVIAENEVLLRVRACGICSSEIETFKSRSLRRVPPLVMGHEFCGEIVETGRKVTTFSTGNKVVSNSVVSCGTCRSCERGHTNLCNNRQVFGMHRPGAFGEFVNVPESTLIHFAENLSYETACLTEPLANGIHMVNLARSAVPEKVLIIGAGAIGLLAMQAFRILTGASVWMADLKEERLRVAANTGAEKIINPIRENLVSLVKDATGDEGVDLVIDAVGTEETHQQALQAVRPGGTVILIGLYENTRSLSSYDIILPEKRIVGTYAATVAEMHEAVALLATGKIDASSWVHYYPLSEGVSAFTEMMEPKGPHIKSVILFP